MTFCDEHEGGCGASINEVDQTAGYCTQCNRQLTTKESVMLRTVTVKRIASGYYESRFPVTLIADDRKIVVTAYAEIIKREDGSGWSFTLKAPYRGFAAYLSAHEDVYQAKSHIVEFFRSERSRYWQYVTDHGLNSWCMASKGDQNALSHT